jgi:hypothetical protein
MWALLLSHLSLRIETRLEITRLSVSSLATWAALLSSFQTNSPISVKFLQNVVLGGRVTLYSGRGCRALGDKL